MFVECAKHSAANCANAAVLRLNATISATSQLVLQYGNMMFEHDFVVQTIVRAPRQHLVCEHRLEQPMCEGAPEE
jgi:hypothetical protein